MSFRMQSNQKLRKIHRKTMCQSLFLNKVTSLRPATLIKTRLWHKYFPVNFAKFLRKPFLTEHLRWLLLKIFPTWFTLPTQSLIVIFHTYSTSLTRNVTANVTNYFCDIFKEAKVHRCSDDSGNGQLW